MLTRRFRAEPICLSLGAVSLPVISKPHAAALTFVPVVERHGVVEHPCFAGSNRRVVDQRLPIRSCRFLGAVQRIDPRRLLFRIEPNPERRPRPDAL